MSARVRVKVCCIADRTEARLAIRSGADAVGLVSHMPSGPGVIPEDRIAEIAADVPPAVGCFLLTSLRDPDQIISQHRRCATNTLQLCDAVDPAAYSTLRRALPGISIVQVIHVTGTSAVEDARHAAPQVDAILLDSGRPDDPTPTLGGTGRVHDWSLSLKIRDAISTPVFLAGGLDPGNVAEAIERVRPYGVDVCSGIRRDGALDEGLLEAFLKECGS